MCSNKSVLFVTFFLSAFLFKPSTPKCSCGYGGYCGSVITRQCYCTEISLGLYRKSVASECSVLQNHCVSSPCVNRGSCNPAFGTFNCECKAGFHGQTCDKQDTQGKSYAKNVMVYYDMHEGKLGDGVSFHVIIKEFGDDFGIKLDDGNGMVYGFSDFEFSALNPNEICKTLTASVKEADSAVCRWYPNAQLNVAKVKLHYPHSQGAALIDENGVKLGRTDKVKLTVSNGDEIQFTKVYPVFTPFEEKVTEEKNDCTLSIELHECSTDTKNPALYRRQDDLIIRCTTQPTTNRCKFVTDISYYWSISGEAYQESIKAPSYRRIQGKTLLPGLYAVELKVELFGSFLAGEPKKSFTSTKKCWFQINWDKVVPIIIGGKRRVVEQYTAVKLDASPSYDPNFKNNNGLRYTWYCKTNHYFCKPQTVTDPIYELLGMEVGTYEMFLSLSNPEIGLPPSVTSQIIDVVKKPAINGFELMCQKNCQNTRVRELTHLQTNIFPSGTVVWKFWKDGIEETNVDSLRQLGTPEDIFIIKQNALNPGVTYIIRATVGDIYSEIQLKTVKPPKSGQCKINPVTGLRGYTNFEVTCSAYEFSHPDEKPLRYNIYQKIESRHPSTSFEPLLISSSQMPVATHLQFISEEIVIEVSNLFGEKVTETLSVKLTDQNIDNTEVDNLVYKAQDNFRNGEVEKGIISIYTIANNLAVVSEESKVINALVENINKVLILEAKDAFQVAACSHFLLVKALERNQSLLLSETVKTASSMLNTMATTIKDIIKKKEFVEMEGLMGLSRSILGTVNSLIHSKNEHLTNKIGNVETYVKSYFDYLRASAHILNTVNDVSATILNQMVPCQNPIKIENEFVVSQLIVDKMDRLVKMGKIDPSNAGAAYIKFDSNLVSYYKNKDIELQVTELKENLFWWVETEYSMNSKHLNIKLCDRETKEEGPIDLDHPIHLFLEIEIVSNKPITAEVEQPPESLTLEEKDLYVKVFKIDMKKGTGGRVFVAFHDLASSELDVIILVDEYPDYDVIKSKGETIKSGNSLYKSQSLAGLSKDSIIYLGVIPSSKHFAGEKISFKYEIYDHFCRVWAKENWDIGSCEVGPDSTKRIVHCKSKHLSLFGASVLVPPNQLHLIKDIALLLTLKDNPYVFSMVMAFLIIYVLLFLWAWKRDKKDKYERNVHLLADNFPGDTFGYLLAVFTGEKTLSGTTAKVGIKIYGSDSKESHVHILNHDKHLLQLGQDNWFLIFTPKHLGDIDYIHVWHDNSGASPDWNCNKIILYDLTTNDMYEFPINKWLSVSMVDENWKLEWELKTRKIEETDWKNLARENFFIGLRETHLWFSIFVRHPRTSYTRIQRLTVAMCLVMFSMLLGLMFYGAAKRMVEDDPTFSLSVREFIIAMECGLISFPVSFLLGTLFKKSRRPGPKIIDNNINAKRSLVEFLLNFLRSFLILDPLLPIGMSKENRSNGDADTKKRKKFLISACLKVTRLTFRMIIGGTKTELTLVLCTRCCHQCGKGGGSGSNKKENFITVNSLYKADRFVGLAGSTGWSLFYLQRIMSFVLIIVCSFFLILYGLKMGPHKSILWVTSTFLRLAQAIFVTLPVRILAKALLLTSIFKEINRNQMLFSVEYKGIDDKLKIDNEYMSKLMELRSKSIYSPLSVLDVMMLSKNRKKKEKWRWNVINFIFVSVLYVSLCILVSGATSNTSYYHTQHLLNLIKTPQSDRDYDVDMIYNISRFFEYFLYTLIPSLHTTHWYNGEDLPIETEEIGTPNNSWRGWMNDYSNKFLGVPRLRQLRIKNGTCTVAKEFQLHFNTCNSSYSPLIEDRKTYTTGWSIPKFDDIGELWKYSSPIDTETIGMFGASGYFYPGGGYVRNLATHSKNSSKGIMILKLENWFDQLTRMIFIEFNTYNVFNNLFSHVTIIIENLASGVIGTRVFVDSAYHQFYLDTLDVTFFIAFVFFIVVLILSVLRMVIHLSVRGLRKFITSKGNLIDLLIIVFGFSSIIIYVTRIGMFKIYSSAYEKTDNESFISFSYPFYHDDLGCVFLCVLVVVTTIRLFQLARYGKYYCILRDTVKESGPYLMCTFVLILFVTSILSLMTYICGIQHSQMFYTLLVPRVDFINDWERSNLDSNEMLFKAAINMIYLLGGMLIIAVFIIFYSKSKFNYITLGRDEGCMFQFLHIVYKIINGLKSLIHSDDVELSTVSGEKITVHQMKIHTAAKEKATKDFKLNQHEAEDVIKHFVTLSKRHKKMCDHLDEILELID